MSTEYVSEVPTWLQTHPELRKRGVMLIDCMKPDVVFQTSILEPPRRVVKVLEPDDQEASIYQRLQHDQDPRNHTAPCEIIESEELQTILLMPFLRTIINMGLEDWSLSKFLEVFLQVVEGVDYLHEQRIAHLDICHGNTLVATENLAKMDDRLIAGRVYIIDFQNSQQLNLRPGLQPAIYLPPAQVRPPPSMACFDPYSWDIYCLGKLFESMAQRVYYGSQRPPWVVRRITAWLLGAECGCKNICRCRPTARRIRQTLTVLRWMVRASDWCVGIATHARSIFVRPPTI